MTFDNPELLWWLLGVPVLVALFAIQDARARRVLQRAVGGHDRAAFMNALFIKQFMQAFFTLVALVALVIAAAEPYWGESSVEDDRSGVDVVFLMDVSNSMLAQDIPPSRLLRSVEVARVVMNRMGQGAVAVVAFKGDASIVVPMTEDTVGFELAMSNLSPALVTTPGTNIAAGLRAALDAFPHGTARHRVVVLFTDGEELEGNVRNVLRPFQTVGVPIVAVVTGTAGGATIPTPNGEVLRDPAGNPITTRADERLLRDLAAQTNGTVLSISDPNITQRVLDAVQARTGRGQSVTVRLLRSPRYRVFLLIALGAMTVALITHVYPWRNRL